MREIKFRGKRIDSVEWVHGYFYEDEFNSFILINLPKESFNGEVTEYVEEIEWVKVMPETVTQYTGLKDKNGKEIYEGDIVKIYNYNTDWKHGEPPFDWRIFQIIWNKYLWAYENSVLYVPMSHYSGKSLEEYDIEIMGNAFENHELLN